MSTSTSSAQAVATATPMMRQYLETKARHQDAILFFRLGDFYEMFFEDAELASSVLEITLTSRAKGDERVPMCGVPYHAARGYIARLVEAGHKVAVCDQVEDPGPGKTLVRREVTRVVTPGMVLDDEILEARSDHFLAALAPGGGLALLDASTGEFRAAELTAQGALELELSRAAPREVIVPAGSELAQIARDACPGVAVHEHDAQVFEPARAAALLKKQLGVATLESFGLAALPAATAAAGAALAYLSETQRREAASHVDRIRVFHAGEHMVLDAATRTNLEITRTIHGARRKGSLLGLIDRTATAIGGRTLARWISYPLLDLEAIRRRHDAVEELSGRSVLREELTGALREVGDLERLLGRLSLGAGTARDLQSLALSLGQLPALRRELGGCRSAALADLVPAFDGQDNLAATLATAVVDNPPPVLRDGGFLRKGFRADLDELLDLSASGKGFIARLETEERERTGIGSLKVRYNRIFGYYIEVTRPNLHLVPPHYVRRQTTAGAERFVTTALQEYEEKVLTAEERRIELEKRIFEELREQVLAQSGPIRRAAAAVGEVDALLSFARVAAELGYVRPEVDGSAVIEIVEGRHPVVERSMPGEQFVPNDLSLDAAVRQILVITGPNMAGKSTVLRQTALIALLAQAGSFVPARRARIGKVDRIFCRVGASDDLGRGQSTFMVEMVETASILHGATGASLVVLDEIGRGTSTFDGLSIAWAVAEYLHDRVGARTLFATHYHELTELSRERPRVHNATIAVAEQGGKVIFLRRLVPGGASRSYGIEVARLAGLPGDVIRRAREILVNLEKNELDPEGRAVFAGKGRGHRPDQLGLFESRPDPRLLALAARLRAIDPDHLTPMDALLLLRELRDDL